MKFLRKRFVLLAFLTVSALLLLLTSCGGAIFSELSEDSDADVFCRTFIDRVLADEKEEAYQMLDGLGSRADFEKLWDYFGDSAEGATAAEIHMTDFLFFTENGTDYFKGQYFVQFNNGRDINLSLITDGKNAVVGLNYLDISGFYPKAEKAVSVLDPVLAVYSLLVLAFCVWMIVDCARRRVRKKALWILLIIAGVSLSLRVGEYGNVSFMVGLFLQSSQAWVDFGYLAVGTKLILPVGAVIYFCLRRRITLTPLPATPIQPLADGYTLHDVAKDSTPAPTETADATDANDSQQIYKL